MVKDLRPVFSLGPLEFNVISACGIGKERRGCCLDLVVAVLPIFYCVLLKFGLTESKKRRE